MIDYSYRRFPTRTVSIGSIDVGGGNPIRIQSMTVSDTMNTNAVVNEIIGLHNAGCEIVRVTAPGIKDADNLAVIKSELIKRECFVPLVADIHFSPRAAIIAVEHVEKVRINPGNYTDKKNKLVTEYSEEQYAEELEKAEESFRPLVLRTKELGKSMRIGVNHGSLSDRILNRYGDTPAGMVESAIEFIKMAEKQAFFNLVISMKASIPEVMIHAYRLLVDRFISENMNYPLHLGVTEAGEGTDGRIKSALGIGSLLEDGIGDTIRVSLTEDSIYEIPVAKEIAKRYDLLSGRQNKSETYTPSAFSSARIKNSKIFDFIDNSSSDRSCGPVRIAAAGEIKNISKIQKCDFIISEICPEDGPEKKINSFSESEKVIIPEIKIKDLKDIAFLDSVLKNNSNRAISILLDEFILSDLSITNELNNLLTSPALKHLKIIAGLEVKTIETFHENALKFLKTFNTAIPDFFTLKIKFSHSQEPGITFCYRIFQNLLEENKLEKIPVMIRAVFKDIEQATLHASIHAGGLILSGAGSIIKIELENGDPEEAYALSLDILQAVRLRVNKTEFISCPSCGRTLFNLQETTKRIREKTGHLKGVKIAIMGCIVNGPGEMADADFGYVGAGPGKIHLYRGKEIIKKNIDESLADQYLIDLIKENNLWQDPSPA